MPGKQLRIAFVDYILDPLKPGRSGLSDIVWGMASELVNQGHESHVIAAYKTLERPDPRVIVHSFPVPPIGYRNVLGHFWLLKRAASIARRLRPDLIHAPEYVSTAVFATLGVASPLILTVPGNPYHRIRYGHSYEWYYLQILKWAARTSARRCDRVIAISKEMKLWWEMTGSTPDRTPWIPLGVDPKLFHYHPGARALLDIPPDQLLLLYVGRLAPEKGLVELIDALCEVRDLLDPHRVRVTIVGEGPMSTAIQDRISADQLGDVVRLSSWMSQEELPSWYSAADGLLLPSHSEGLARALLEAMNCGTPVIGTRITGTQDHVRDGTNGFLFPAGDVTALARILADVIQRPDILRRMRPATLIYASTELTWPAIMNRIVQEVYVPVIEARIRCYPGRPAA